MALTAQSIAKQISKHLRLNYLQYLPPGHSSAPGAQPGRWPVILFLHGGGERGTDLELVINQGAIKVAQDRGLPFVMLAPQCPLNHWWSDFLPLLDDMIQSAVEHLNGDPDRVYLTGLSMGGYGTWHMAVEYPNRFAAIAPICGSGPWMYNVRERLGSIRHLPTWVFHGDDDEVVPSIESKVMVQSLKDAGGDVRFTLYPGVGHDSWTRTYANEELYDWFLQHTRRKG